ncbi:MAG: RNA methyltransferase [Chloroflexi bacterium]|nr:RNA methyltransferase [Chloroflexota bacterium]
MPFKGNYNRPGGSQKQRQSGDLRPGNTHFHPNSYANQAKAAQDRKASVAPQEEKQPGLITSPDNDKARFIRNLLSKKDRYAAKHFVVEGVRLVWEALKAPKPPMYTLYDADALAKTTEGQRLLMRLIELVEDKKGVFPATERVMEGLSDTVTPQGVAAAVPFLQWQPADFAEAKLHLVLDEVQDPGNLGTILRSAWAAGETSVYLTEGSVDFYSPKVVRAGMGAHFKVPAAIGQTWEQLGDRLEKAGVEQILLADGGDEPIPVSKKENLPEVSYYEVDWSKPTAVIIGNEAHGAGAEARKAATHLLRIPMPGGAESLNASVAASLIIFEALRQRSQPA